MAVSTTADICRGALQDLSILAAGQVMSASDGDLALERLNGLLDQWAAERLAIYESARTTWTLTQASSFTVGTGATISVARPVWVDHVAYRDTALTTPVEIPLAALTQDGYAAYAMKTLTNTYPAAWYYDHTFSASGFGALFLLPIPTGSGLQGVLYSPKQVARYAALTTAFSLPPGYERFIRTNLAVELATSFERQPTPWLLDAARESKGVVKRANIRPAELATAPGALIGGRRGGRWNIFTDS